MDEPTPEPTPALEPNDTVASWITLPPASVPPANRIELWSPKGIGWASFLLGFPGGVVLAALNWRRMGRTRKAIAHLAAAVIGLWTLYLVAAPVLGLVAIVISYYLYWAQRNDQAPFAAAGLVTSRSSFGGAAIALVATLLVFLPILLIEVAAGYGGFDHRGEVLFSRSVPADCSSVEQAIVFGPDDPIFLTAVMRERVQPGSHVVVQVVDPTGTNEFPVTVRPPFDCVGSTGSVAPLDPGEYAVHYRYDGQPGTPDLASGSFTVTASPAASPSP